MKDIEKLAAELAGISNSGVAVYFPSPSWPDQTIYVEWEGHRMQAKAKSPAAALNSAIRKAKRRAQP